MQKQIFLVTPWCYCGQAINVTLPLTVTGLDQKTQKIKNKKSEGVKVCITKTSLVWVQTGLLVACLSITIAADKNTIGWFRRD